MARRFPFRQVDVFTDRPLAGNPLAVFTDARGLSDAEMAAMAREMNLSETCFVLPVTDEGRAASADYRLRIFTPGLELPFAGHPSIGAAWVLADDGRLALAPPATVVRQELPIGVLPVSIEVLVDDDGRTRVGEVTMTQGRPDERHRLDERETQALCDALGVPRPAVGWPGGRGHGSSRSAPVPAVISTGLPHLVVPFVDAAVMLGIDQGAASRLAVLLAALGCPSAALVAPGGSGAITDADVRMRVLDAEALGIGADPATGSAAGPVAVFLGRLADLRDGSLGVVIEQGTELGRPSRLRAEVGFGPEGQPREVRVSGRVVPVLEGVATLP